MFTQIDKRESAFLLAAGIAVGLILVLVEAPIWAVYVAAAGCGVMYVALSMRRVRGDEQPRGETRESEIAQARPQH